MFGTSGRTIGGRATRTSTALFCQRPRRYRDIYHAAPGKTTPPAGRSYRLQGCRQLCLAPPRPAVEWGKENGAGDAAKRLGQEIAQVLRTNGTRLILHFDLNKTLIMVDPAGRKTQAQVLNSVLAEICWGHVEHSGAEETSVWTWNGAPPSTEPPLRRTLSGSRGLQQQNHHVTAPVALVSYSDFLHQEFGDAEGKDNRRMKDIRDERKGCFTEDGQPGVGLRAEYLKLEKALALPEAVAKSPLAKGAGLAGRESHYILPSFFWCLLALKEADADFGVVFRTFGDDIPEVAREYNAFCEGNHPLFPGAKMDGSDGRGDYRVHLADQAEGSHGHNTLGAFFRDEKGLALVMGTLDNPQDRHQLRSIESKGHPVYRSVVDTHDAICERVLSALPPAGSVAPKPAATTTTAGPPPSCGESTNGIAGSGETTNHGRCLALRDFYPFWRKNLESAEAGKVLPVDLSDTPKVWPVMFDDNIGHWRPDGSGSDAHIVDVRDMVTGRPVPFDMALERHIVRAEPFLAIDREDVAVGAADDAFGHNFFLVHILKRLALERAGLYTSACDGFPSKL
ncbi:unnamed protein product [Ectocarpus sp. CCAP 1310/34]|nr:unnamed protein product [Ectocarpus sp. CCAP 1310/34]